MAEPTTAHVKCVVVGAGPVGALAALYAARRGWDVEVYELRSDVRHDSTTPLHGTKTINLALSERGINALRHSNSAHVLDAILNDTIPMHGRMIHSQDRSGGLTERAQPYDLHQRRHINAVRRGDLHARLLDELEGLSNVRLRFNHKLTGVDFERRLAWLEQRGPSRRASALEDGTWASSRPGRPDEIEIAFHLLMGCDGAHSAVRFHMMKFVRLDYQQSYIDTLWCPFQIPPADDKLSMTPSAKDGFRTSPNHLHIWPGKDKMFIAIPSVDKTFASTLFAPPADFQVLENDPSQIEFFFNAHFPGAVDLIGPELIREQFCENAHLPLISIKCSPHHYGSTGVILGDAAHAMVPFYGQGMNAGLEDVRVLFSHLDAQPTTAEGRAKALHSYNAERLADAHAINDLSLANFWDMRAGVTSRVNLLRKKVEQFLADRLPSTGFATQYSRVSFSNQRYSDVIKAVNRQREVLLRGMTIAVLLPVIGWTAYNSRNRPDGFAALRFMGDRIRRIFSLP